MPPWVHGLVAADPSHIAWWQMCVRAAIVFFAGLVLIRLVGARTFARGSPLDIVVSVILGSNLSRAITGSASLGPTLLASAAIVGLHALLITGSLRLHPLAMLLKGKPAILLEDGETRPHTLVREGISRGDFEEVLRDAGVTDPSEVRLAVRERSGKVSVIKHAAGARPSAAHDGRPAGRLEDSVQKEAVGEGEPSDPRRATSMSDDRL